MFISVFANCDPRPNIVNKNFEQPLYCFINILIVIKVNAVLWKIPLSLWIAVLIFLSPSKLPRSIWSGWLVVDAYQVNSPESSQSANDSVYFRETLSKWILPEQAAVWFRIQTLWSFCGIYRESLKESRTSSLPKHVCGVCLADKVSFW